MRKKDQFDHLAEQWFFYDSEVIEALEDGDPDGLANRFANLMRARFKDAVLAAQEGWDSEL